MWLDPGKRCADVIDALVRPDLLAEGIDRVHAGFVLALSTIWFSVASVFLAAAAAGHGSVARWLLNVVVAPAPFLVLCVTRNLRVTAHVTAGLLAVTQLGALFVDATSSAIAPAYLVTAPLCAIFLIGTRAGFAWGAFVVGAFAVFEGMQAFGLFVSVPAPPAHPLVEAFALFAFVGVITAFIGFKHDLRLKAHAQIVEQNRELAAARVEADCASRAKSEFLANMSHEIRTPMNGIVGITEVLMNSELSEEQRDLVHLLQSSGGDLLTIIDDLFELSRLDAGRLELQRVPFSLEALLAGVRDHFEREAEEKGVELVLEVDDAPSYIVGDPARLEQVLLNLCGNAVKFTAEGSVRIVVERRALGLRFSIVDTGIGIEPEVRSSIFRPFTQADNSTTRRFGGTGLGLAITKRLIDVMGGRIDFESVVDEGTTFWFEIAFEEAEPPNDETAPDGPTRPAHVLIVDDSAVNRLVVAKAVSRCGATYDFACDGVEAVEAVQNTTYDLVFMDCQMPRMDGYEATRTIRRVGDARPVRIVALTANASLDDRRRCLAAGMDGYLTKPIRSELLVKVLDHVSARPTSHSSGSPKKSFSI